MKKGILILTLLILALFSVSCIYASDVNDTLAASEDNLEIDQTTDDVISVEEDMELASSGTDEVLKADEQTFTQLNVTINGNADNDIYLESDYKYSDGDGGFKDGIVINRDVNIYGNGHTIDGNKNARIFKINGGNVVFYNITFVKGYTATYDSGGAINGNCKAINCTFYDNHAAFGGAMYGGSAVNCIFRYNDAQFYIDEVEFGGGGAMHSGSAVNCTFLSNYAKVGGAMVFCSAVNCTFSYNIASSDGGAMANSAAVNCTFMENTAYEMGGAMAVCYAVNCIGQNPEDYYNTNVLVLKWVANNFTVICGSDETLPIKLICRYLSIDFIDYDVVIYNEAGYVKTYHCLSNDDLSLDLPIGIYTAELIVTFPGLTQTEPKNITLTVTDGTTFCDLNKTINGNDSAIINLDKDYTFNPATDSDFTAGIVINRNITIYGNGHTIDGNKKARIFQINGGDVTFYNITFVNGNADNDEYDAGGAVIRGCKAINCTFKENHASGYGGAMYGGFAVDCIFTGNSVVLDGGAMYGGSAVNCIFTGNSAEYGGAMLKGSAVNCTFTNNYADCGGAKEGGSAENCIFTGNNAGDGGGAVYNGNAVNCIFIGNNANAEGGAMYDGSAVNCTFTDNRAYCAEAMYEGTAILCIFENNGYLDTTIGPVYLNASNFTSLWGSGEKLLFNLTVYNTNYYGFNTTITVFKDGQSVGTYYVLSGDGWVVNLTSGTYKAVLSLDKYEGVVNGTVTLTINKLNSTLTINDNVTFDYGTNGLTTVSFINASGVVAEVIGQPDAIVVVNDTTITVSGLDAGTYTLTVTTITDANHNNITKNATITVNKLKTQLTANAITTTYNINKDLVITLKDANGNAVSGVKITVDLNGAKTYTADKNGQVKVSTKGLAPKTYTAKITFNGNTNYAESIKDVKVTVKKAKPKIIAKKKTYKAKKKTKKFTITLKDNRGKAIKNVKVRLIVQKIKKTSKKKTNKKSKKNKKKNIVKTNKKGKATFKINRHKKGKYLATVKFYGNKYYAKTVKKVKINMK